MGIGQTDGIRQWQICIPLFPAPAGLYRGWVQSRPENPVEEPYRQFIFLAREISIIDLDILRNEFTPAYIKSVPGGHTVEVVMNNVREVTGTGKVSAVSLFCCDFDTYDRNPELGELTYQNGARIISAVLEGWKGIPDK